MSKKRKRTVPKSDKFTVLTSTEATLMRMPKYDAHTCGHGAHGKRGYDRKSAKRELAREVAQAASLRLSAI